jgi:hypothetical protein
MTAQHFGYTVGGATTEGKQPELIKRERVKNEPLRTLVGSKERF